MERNEKFNQRNLYHYKNNLSPFGQKIFNVLLNNWNKEKRCSQNRHNNGGDRCYGQKKILLHFDDSSTPIPQLYSQYEQLSGYDTRNSFSNRNIVNNNQDVPDVAAAELPSVVTARKSDDDEISSNTDARLLHLQNKTTARGSNARVLQFMSTHKNIKEVVSNNVMTAGYRLSLPVQNNPNTISTEFQFHPLQKNYKEVRSNVTSTEINKFKSVHNHLTKENTDITSSGLLQFQSKLSNDKEHRQNVISAEPVVMPVYDCNSNVASASLLQIQPIQNIDNEIRSKVNPSVLFDSFRRTSKEDTMGDDDNSLRFFHFSPVKKDAVEDSHSVCRLDLLRPVEFGSNEKYDKALSESCNVLFNGELSMPLDGNKARRVEKSNVLWSDMFDTELLPKDIIAPAVKQQISDEQNAAVNHKELQISFLKENAKTQAQSNKNKEKVKFKSIKRKNDKTLNEATVFKRLRETNNNTNKKTERKVKYTKTVKKWLDTVDASHAVETGDNQKDVNVDINVLAQSDKTVDKTIIVDKSELAQKKKKNAKKVVQARLANKGGVMKFDKPEILPDSGKDDLPNDSLSAESSSKVTNRVSLKKGKPKFVAPLKSQIPVIEIEYNVVVVDENNSEEHLAKMKNLNNTEVYAVLTYSNGFCQLNKQFTEDDCIPDGVMLYIEDEFYYFQKSDDRFSDVIIKFLENHTVVCYEGKNILIFFKHHFDMEIDICMHDVQIAGSLLEPDSPPESFGALQKLASCEPGHTVAARCARRKAAWYLTLLRECARTLKDRLVENALWSLFVDIEMPVLPVIAEMEFHGIAVDTAELQRMEDILVRRLRRVERQCSAAAGGALSPRSPAQVSAALYGRLRLHERAHLAVRATGARGDKSTSEDMLRMLVPLHPLPGLVLEYRRLHKAHATFLAGVRRHVRDGVLRPTWVQTAAATGRIACNNPNVQAIPKTPFRLSSEDDEPAEEALNLRSVYRARPGHVLLAADFRQMECRVFAAAAGDAALRAALASGRDLFSVLAAQWLKKPEEQVSSSDRERTKRIVYASLYGAGAAKLRAILADGRDQAASVSASFHRAFPSLKSFVARVQRSWWSGREPRTPAGRARPLPALRDARPPQRARALRQAVNFLVQGTAADVCKVAMARAGAALRAAGVRARTLLQIHDELVWELPEDQLARAHAVVGAAMAGAGPGAGLHVALPAALRAGPSWAALAPLPPATSASRPAGLPHCLPLDAATNSTNGVF